MQEFAVIGLGNFGGTLAASLHELGLPVVAIDVDPDQAQEFRDRLDNVVVADATDRDTLKALGVGECGVAVISLGDDLETSVLVTLHCSELGVSAIYAKVVSSTHARILEKLGATTVIFPEREAARRLAQKLSSPNLVDFLPLSAGYSVEEIRIPEPFIGQTLAELNVRQRYGVQVVAIRESQAPDAPIRMPQPDTRLEDDDILVLIGPNDKLGVLSDL